MSRNGRSGKFPIGFARDKFFYMPNEGSHFPETKQLNTDILEQKYGPIHAVVMRHDNVVEAKPGAERIREAHLVDEQDISRTYALTFLTYDKDNTELVMIDEEIRNGGLIGETFRTHGYTVKKNVIDVFLIDIPQWLQKDFQESDTRAKARFTEFYAKKEGVAPVVYGIVLEIYSPDFKDPNDGINDVDRAQVNPLTGALQNVGVPGDEIWERLDRAAGKNRWDDVQERYDQAHELSMPVVASLHKKVEHYINAQQEPVLLAA